LLGVIVVACVAGLIQVIDNPPQVVKAAPPPQVGQGTIQSQGGGTTGGAGTTTAPPTAPVSSTVANTVKLRSVRTNSGHLRNHSSRSGGRHSRIVDTTAALANPADPR
jgi:hypothetical protein